LVALMRFQDSTWKRAGTALLFTDEEPGPR